MGGFLHFCCVLVGVRVVCCISYLGCILGNLGCGFWFCLLMVVVIVAWVCFGGVWFDVNSVVFIILLLGCWFAWYVCCISFCCCYFVWFVLVDAGGFCWLCWFDC